MTTTWTYRSGLRPDTSSFLDYGVEATDGGIGKVVSESLDIDASHLVVDTGFWIFGTKRLVPAGLITRVDHADETIYLDMTKDQVKDSPEYQPHDPNSVDHDAYRRPFVEYYSLWPWV